MSLWLRLEVRTITGPKLRRFARLLRCSEPTALGHLVSLWANTLIHYEMGDLTKCSYAEIAELGNYPGNPPAAFLSALEICTLVDVIRLDGRRAGPKTPEDTLIFIHDWFEYAAPYLLAKYATNNAKKEAVKLAISERRHLLQNSQSLTNSLNTPTPSTSVLSEPQTGIKPVSNRLQTGIDMDTNEGRSPAGEELTEETKKNGDYGEEKESLNTLEIAEKAKKDSLNAKKELNRIDRHENKKLLDKIKMQYLDAVFLTREQYQALRIEYSHNLLQQMDRFGDQRLQYALEKLNNYLMSKKGKDPYKSHYHVLLGWVKKEVYSDEKRGLLVFREVKVASDVPLDEKPVFCDDCEKWMPTKEYAGHPCRTESPAIDIRALPDAVDYLKRGLIRLPRTRK